MKRIILITSIIAFAIFLLNSCIDSSNTKTITIEKDEELVFYNSEFMPDVRNILIKNDNNETIIVDNLNFTKMICYYKEAYPEKDIYVEYNKNKKGEIEIRRVWI